MPAETKTHHSVTEAQKMAKAAAEILDQGKATNVVILEVQGLTVIADYFVIASVPTQRHARALVDRVLESLNGIREPGHIEGYEGGYGSLWITATSLSTCSASKRGSSMGLRGSGATHPELR